MASVNVGRVLTFVEIDMQKEIKTVWGWCKKVRIWIKERNSVHLQHALFCSACIGGKPFKELRKEEEEKENYELSQNC